MQGAVIEKDFSMRIGNCIVYGRFDRIYPNNNPPLIVDWKTDSDSLEKIKEDYENQMKLYALGLYLQYPMVKRPEKIVVKLGLTSSGNIIDLIYTSAGLESYFNELDELLNQSNKEHAMVENDTGPIEPEKKKDLNEENPELNIEPIVHIGVNNSTESTIQNEQNINGQT